MLALFARSVFKRLGRGCSGGWAGRGGRLKCLLTGELFAIGDELRFLFHVVGVWPGALGQRYPPNIFIRLDAIDADLTIFRGSRVPDPSDLEVGFLAAVLHTDDVAFFVQAIQVAQPPAQAGYVNHVCRLDEGLAVAVHSPHPHGQIDLQAIFVSAAHEEKRLHALGINDGAPFHARFQRDWLPMLLGFFHGFNWRLAED